VLEGGEGVVCVVFGFCIDGGVALGRGEMDGEEVEPGEGGDALGSEGEVEPRDGDALKLELESERDGEGSGVARARHAGQRPSEAGPWSHFVSSLVSRRRSNEE
jgi:hypothetical protein